MQVMRNSGLGKSKVSSVEKVMNKYVMGILAL